MKKILLIGSQGLLGRTLQRRLGERAVGIDRDRYDITDAEQIEAMLAWARPSVLINCAAYTAVDRAESEPEAARRLNADAVELLGQAAARHDAHLIAISTDYVFNGQGSDPFAEDAPESAFGPESVYGRTKLEGERRLRALGGSWCIARTQWLYGAGGKNFVDTIAGLAAQRPTLRVVDDQVGAPTWTEDLAGALITLADARAEGVYHTVNSGYVSWCEVARRVVARLELPCEIVPCRSEEFPTPARRPQNSRLAQSKFAALNGGPLRPWTEALDEYLAPRADP